MNADVGTRILRVATATLLSVSALAAVQTDTGSASEPADVPVVRATTVVRAIGHAGTRIEVPDGVRLHEEDITLDVEDGTYGVALLGPTGCSTPASSLCLSHRAYRFPNAFGGLGSSNGQDDGRIDPGLYDVYVLTDGNAELHLEFTDGQEGVIIQMATGAVDAHVEALDVHCVEDPSKSSGCTDGAFGGATHHVTPPGYAAAAAYAYAESTGSSWAVSCLDPHSGTSANGARDSAYGCPFSPTDEDWDPLLTASIALGSTPTLNGGANNPIQTNNNPDGEVYAGFYAREQSPLAEGGYAGFGFWLSGGIDFT